VHLRRKRLVSFRGSVVPVFRLYVLMPVPRETMQ
jgi:hypothetical protein